MGCAGSARRRWRRLTPSVIGTTIARPGGFGRRRIRRSAPISFRSAFGSAGLPLTKKEGPALAAVRERLRHESEGVLLIYDNAIDARSLKPFLPTGGASRVLVTSNSHAWRGVAAPVKISPWLERKSGAEYLIARTGRDQELADAEGLSEALEGACRWRTNRRRPIANSLASRSRNIESASKQRPCACSIRPNDAPSEYYDGLSSRQNLRPCHQ